MIATISMQSGIQDHHRMLSLSANAAGSPLPLIPRRSPHLMPSPSWPLSLSPHSSPSLSTSPSLSSLCDGNEPTIVPSASIVTITPATPPKTESDSDSLLQGHGQRRKRNAYVPNTSSLYPPELSTPIPSLCILDSPTSKNSTDADATPRATPAPLIYTPGMPLRLSVESLRKNSSKSVSLGLALHSIPSLQPSSTVSESLSPSSSITSTSPTNTPLIRKKSGQVVRPSLKSSASYSSPRSFNLGTISPNLTLSSSKSEPVTPFNVTTPTTSKAVHFDQNLEQIKLFLTEQKPLAVSREGSPVDTDEGETSASGNENNEIARFFGSMSVLGDLNKKSERRLRMDTNIPLRPLSFLFSSPDVTLESLMLAKGEKSIMGSVVVRNIAYDKSVTARFSFDGWCTTSEVNASWKGGVGAEKEARTEWDRFEFVIWLGDLKLGEEGISRKLELAIRYRITSRGLEVWDNNGGRNYIGTFDRQTVPEKERGRRGHVKQKIPSAPLLDDDLSDLLEKPGFSKTNRKSRSISPTVSKSKWMPMPLKCSASTSPAALHTRTRSFPFSASSPSQPSGKLERSPSSSPSPLVSAWLTRMDSHSGDASPMISPSTPTTLGSPRDLGDDTFHSHIKFPTLDFEERMDDSRPESRKIRRHQRGDYFDAKLIPQESMLSGKHARVPAEPVTPTPSPSSRFHSPLPWSFTLYDSAEDQNTLPRTESRVKELSTDFVNQSKIIPPQTFPSSVGAHSASDDASDSSSTSTLLENESPHSSRSSTPPLEGLNNGDQSNDDRELYREFLNRFCFFTGPGSSFSTRLDEVMNMMNESGSESSTPTITPSESIQDSD